MTDDGTLVGEVASALNIPKPSWFWVFETIVDTAVPAIVAAYGDPDPMIGIIAPVVSELFDLGKVAVTDLATGKDLDEVRKSLDDAIVALAETVKFGPKA